MAENKYLSDVGSVLHWSLPFLEMVTQISLPPQMFMYRTFRYRDNLDKEDMYPRYRYNLDKEDTFML